MIPVAMMLLLAANALQGVVEGADAAAAEREEAEAEKAAAEKAAAQAASANATSPESTNSINAAKDGGPTGSKHQRTGLPV